MILENAKPRLNEAIVKANLSNKKQEVTFIYNEMLTSDTISSVFFWLFKESVAFETRHDDYRFVVIIHPKNKELDSVENRKLLIDFCSTKHARDIIEYKTSVREGVDNYLNEINKETK